MQFKRYASSLYFAIGLVLASFVFGLFFYSARGSKDTISVVGFASEKVTADVLKWSFTLTRQVGLNDLKLGYNLIGEDFDYVKSILQSKLGVQESSILISPIDQEERYEYNKHIGYNIVQNISVIVEKEGLDKLIAFSLKPTELLDKNIVFRSSHLSFTLSDISALKRQLLFRATDDAKLRANAIAKSSKNKIGKLRSLRVGVFQITEPYSTEVSSMGIYNTSSKEKSISVTVNASFYLE